MKDATLEIDLEKLPKEKEKSTNYSIDISEYDPSSTYIELKEDIDEKMILYIEREIRASYEYKKYINYLKTELDLTKCSLLPGIDCRDGAASLEFHHYPLNLYEITEIITNKMVDNLSEDQKISCFDIAELVMKEHFMGNVGLVPLTKTLHDMAHNKSIIVPITKVEGNYKNFIKKYSSYISDDIKDRIKEAEINSISEDAKIYNKSKLEKNITTFDINYLSKEDSDEI